MLYKKDNNIFYVFKEGKATFVFPTAENELSFKKETVKGKANLENIMQWFDVEGVGYSNQIHSDIVNINDGTIKDGDSVVSKKVKTAIGVFTADCVPVLMYDKKNNVIAAIHSGWKGTYSLIVKKTIEKMKEVYHTDVQDLVAYIGPHISDCCYEVSVELIDKFKSLEIYKQEDIHHGRKLNLEECIRVQMLSEGMNDYNINSLGVCTYCSTELKFHSFRRSKDDSGRMFSFVYLEA